MSDPFSTDSDLRQSNIAGTQFTYEPSALLHSDDAGGAAAEEFQGVEGSVPPAPSPFRHAARQFARNPLGMIALAYLLLVLFVGLFGSWLAPHDPNAQDFVPLSGPTGENWLGTDDLGRDQLSRLIDGASVSVRASYQTVAMALVIAIPIGLIAGYLGGRVDNVLSRLMDALLSFPALVLALVIAAVLGPGLGNALIAITVVVIPGLVRIIRGSTLAVTQETYVEASRSIGTPTHTILRKRVLPSVLSPLIVAVTLLLGVALVAEAALSFLGLGTQPPDASWGNMLRRAYTYIFSDPWQMVPAGVAIALAVLAFNMVGDSIRDSLGLADTTPPRGSKRGKLGTTTVERKHAPATAAPAGSAPATSAPAGSASAASATATQPLLSVRNLEVEFATHGGPLTVVDGVTFDVAEGEVVGLVGESGCGKTVTSLAIMRLLQSPPARIVDGEVWLAGRDLLSMPFKELADARGDELSMVFQDPMASINPAFTVGNQLIEAVRIHRDVSKADARARAIELLELVGIPDPTARLDEYPHRLSGGMRQRVLIAMALVNEPKLLIADEPTTALDVTVQAQILDLLRTLQHELGMAMIFVTHDLGVIADLADRVVVMYAGHIVEQAGVQDLFTSPRHPYTQKLLSAIPQATPKGQRLVSIPGVVPVPGHWAAGCRFSPRCPYVIDECLAAPVELTTPAPNREVRCIRNAEVSVTGSDALTVAGAAAAVDVVPIIEAKGLQEHFPIEKGVFNRVHGHVQAVDGVDLTIERGQSIGLVGESGSGKSTLGRLITRLIEPTGGTLLFDGQDITHASLRKVRPLRRHMQMVFQDPYTSLAPYSIVGESVAEPLRTQLRMSGKELDERVDELFGMVRLSSSYRNRYPHEFSGGQLQRISVARALATNPKLVILDEPVSSLDVSTQAEVINLLTDLRGELDVAYMFIAHDLSVVRHVADSTAVMYLGRIVEMGPTELVHHDPQHPYTIALLSAIPVPDPVEQRTRERIVLEGDVPSPINPPSGCRFRTRCPSVMPVCSEIDPPRAVLPDGRTVFCHLHPPVGAVNPNGSAAASS